MRSFDIIKKKKEGLALTAEEIRFMIEGFTSGKIPDYQVSALLMAICLKGMDEQETATLTLCMAESGDQVDLSAIDGIKVDKHSTGGVGDKTTLVVAPMVAACGLKVAKMSGRGLGHTGGTVDKLEAIPGFQTALAPEAFFAAVRKTGLAVVGQSGNLAPADKKLYALRDVTATVDSVALIASSIMSKKIAAGADAILLDVKTGSGAFMKHLDDAIGLAQAMVQIGETVGRRTAALITDMDIPLGHAIGNAMEVAEAVDTLRGNGPQDLTEICVQLAANMLVLGGKGTLEQCVQMARAAISDGSALQKLRDMVKEQGGDVSVIDDPARFEQAKVIRQVTAKRSGYIAHMDTEACGIASVMLGAGRETKDSAIDMSAGILILKKTGDYVREGEPVAQMHTSKQGLIPAAEARYLQALTFADQPPQTAPLVMARVTRGGVERF